MSFFVKLEGVEIEKKGFFTQFYIEPVLLSKAKLVDLRNYFNLPCTMVQKFHNSNEF